jgi:hypothetical protein
MIAKKSSFLMMVFDEEIGDLISEDIVYLVLFFVIAELELQQVCCNCGS